jgi:hypothetical protein
MWQVSYVFKSRVHAGLIRGKEYDIRKVEHIDLFLERAKELEYTDIRWRKV